MKKQHVLTPSVFLILFLSFSTLLAQKTLQIKHSCNFANDENNTSLYTYEPSIEANQIVDKILKAIVLSPNFILKAADCKNALASVEGKSRYILYSTTFLENFKKDAQTAWAAYSVLAHEIGHHLNNHDLEEANPAKRKIFELEADKFAGGVLYKLGASLAEAQAGINSFSLEGETTTHPKKFARLEAVANGWKTAEETAKMDKGDNTDINSDENKLLNASLIENDDTKAIELLSKAIEIKPNFGTAYTKRAGRYLNIDKIDAALEDLTAALDINKNDYEAWALQGSFKLSSDATLEDGLKDINRAIRIKSDYWEAYEYRTDYYKAKGDFEKALKDYDKVLTFNPKYAEAHYQKGLLYKYQMGDSTNAFAAFYKTLDINPSHIEARSHIATYKFDIGDYATALTHLETLEKADTAQFREYIRRAQSYLFMKKYKEALSDANKSIAKNPNILDGYLYRGIAKMLLQQKESAQNDFNLLTVKYKSSIIISDINYLERVVATKYMDIGCELVRFGMYNEAIPWLDKALKADETLIKAKECREVALKRN